MYRWLSRPTRACIDRSGWGSGSCAMVGGEVGVRKVEKLDLLGESFVRLVD